MIKYAKRFKKELSLDDKKYILEYQFNRRMGYKPNIDNPTTFNEKLQWLKLYYHNPLITTCADKYKVKKYVSDKIGKEYVVPLIAVYNKPEDIDFDKLPSQFVLKTTWGCGNNLIVKDKTKLNRDNTIKLFAKWLNIKKNHYYLSFEWGYKNIEPKIICEKILVEKGRPTPMDYKLFCFNGKVEFVTVTLSCSHEDGSHRDTVEKNFYDRDFNYIDVRFSDDNFDPKLVEKPKNLSEMIEIAEKLSTPFPEVRVDMYNIDGKIYFSEMTFYHNGGYNESTPKDFVKKMGDKIILPINNKKSKK